MTFETGSPLVASHNAGLEGHRATEINLFHFGSSQGQGVFRCLEGRHKLRHTTNNTAATIKLYEITLIMQSFPLLSRRGARGD